MSSSSPPLLSELLCRCNNVVDDEISYPLMLPLRKILQQVVVGGRTKESEEGRLNNNEDQEKRNMHEESDDIVRIVAFVFIF